MEDHSDHIDTDNEQPAVPNVPKELREAYERTKAENETLRAQVRRGVFIEAGIDPDAGVGKLLFSSYDGDADVAKVREFAAEYDVAPTARKVEQTPEQARWDQSQRTADLLAQSSTPLPDQSDPAVRINEYEKEGDWVNAMALQIEAITNQQSGG